MKARLASLAKAAPCAISVVLLGLTLWPFNLFLLSFVALVPWLRSLKEPDANWRRSGFLMGMLFFGLHMSWLLPFIGRWTGSYPLAAIPWIISSLLQAPFFLLLAWLIWRCYRLGWVWAIPLVWAAVEFLRSALPVLHFPHALIASPLAVTPQLIQTAALGTIFFVSAWVALINVCVVEAFDRANPRATVSMVSVFLAFGLFSYARHGQMPDGEKKVVSIGQLGTDLAFGDPFTEKARIASAVPPLSEQAFLQKADFLLLPEGLGPAGPDPKNPNWPFEPPLTPVLFGMQRGSGPFYQSAFAYDGQWQHVDKTRLVIFGEFVPFRGFFDRFGAFNLPAGDLQPGARPGVLTLAGIRIGPVVCFEALFPDVTLIQAQEGAQLLAVMSIDDWYLGSPMPEQLWAGSVFRAVENGLPLVRSASLGYTGWIDARGNTRVRLPIGENRTVRAEVTVPKGSDAVPYRGLFPWLAALASLVVMLAPIKKKAPAEPEPASKS